MSRCALLRTLAAAILALAAGEAAADSLRCGTGIVQVGDSKLDLSARCGRPALVDQRVEERAAFGADGRPAPGRLSVTVEQWTFDFGPQEFIQLVTLEGGKIVRIERGGYGHAGAPVAEGEARKPPRARCDASALRVGDTKLDLLAKCGEPATSAAAVETRTLNAAGGARRAGQSAAVTTVEIETWTYDFGPQEFVHSAVLENGKVVRVDRGSYGYAR